VDAAYYPLVDLVTTYESSYSSFSIGSLSSASSTPRSKQTVILTDAPASGSYSSVISQLQDVGVAAIYITDASISSQDIPRQFSAWVSDVASVSGVRFVGFSSIDDFNHNFFIIRDRRHRPLLHQKDPRPIQPPIHPIPLLKYVCGLVTAVSKLTYLLQQNLSSHHSPPIGAIVGGILGALVIIMFLVTILLCMRNRRRRIGKCTCGSSFLPHEQFHQNWPNHKRSESLRKTKRRKFPSVPKLQLRQLRKAGRTQYCRLPRSQSRARLPWPAPRLMRRCMHRHIMAALLAVQRMLLRRTQEEERPRFNCELISLFFILQSGGGGCITAEVPKRNKQALYLRIQHPKCTLQSSTVTSLWYCSSLPTSLFVLLTKSIESDCTCLCNIPICVTPFRFLLPGPSFAILSIPTSSQ
jgi:hypothetical protein